MPHFSVRNGIIKAHKRLPLKNMRIEGNGVDNSERIKYKDAPHLIYKPADTDLLVNKIKTMKIKNPTKKKYISFTD